MGIDWRDQTWWSYQAALYHWNAIHSGEEPEPDFERLKAIAGRAH